MSKMTHRRALALRTRLMDDAKSLHAYVLAAVTELQAAQATQGNPDRVDGSWPQRSRVPDKVREQLANAPAGVVDLLVTLLELPAVQGTTIASAIDLLGVIAPKETLLETWLHHGRRIRDAEAHEAFFSALRDRGEEGYWVLDALAELCRRQREEAKAPGLSAERMRELALETDDPDAFSAVLDRADVPVGLLVELAKSGHATSVADHPKLPIEVILDLARGRDYIVAALAMENRAMPPEMFAEFADHEAEIVRLAIAERAQYDGDVPTEVVEKLANDRSERVRAAVAAWRVEMLAHN